MPLNFQLAGKSYPAVDATVTSEQIAAYAAASSDDNPQHRPGPGQVASAVFPVVPGFAELGRVAGDPELGLDNPLMVVHGEQAFRYHRPIRPGDRLVLTPSLAAVEDKGRGATFVVRTAVTTPDGAPVVDVDATVFVRGGGSGSERAVTARPEPPPRLAETGRFASFVDGDMPPRYAAVSGDFNPVHLDAAVAEAVGLPGVINHGLGTLSLVAGGLVRLAAGGDVTRLRSLDVRFTGMVFPPSQLETVIWGSEPPGRFVFETTRPGGTAVLVGTFDVETG